MAWTASVAQKNYQNGILLVNVSYTDGTNVFNEVIDLTGGDINTAKAKVRSRIAALTVSDTLAAAIPIGPLNPGSVAQSTQDIFLTALRHFQACKRAVDLGLITTADTLYTDAQADMITKWSPAFIDAV